jgi:1-acyl-sn-glycerol-3-phosphate acyltransferase
MDLRHRLLRRFFRLLLSLVCRVRIEGIEKLPARRPLVIVTNHLHFLDVPLAFTALPGHATMLAADKWSRHFVANALFRFSGAVFVNRGTADLKALREIQKRLERGEIVVIAPEGTRSRTGGLQKGKGGAVLLASKTRATLAPVVAYGQERVFSELRRLRRAEVTIRIGDPFEVPQLAGANKSRQLDAMTTDVMLHIARLLPPQYQGVYRPLVTEGASRENESRHVSMPDSPG